MQHNKTCFNLIGYLESFTPDPLLRTIANLIDSKSYGTTDIKVVIEAASEIKDHFNDLLKANDSKEYCLGNYFTRHKFDKPCQKLKKAIMVYKSSHPPTLEHAYILT